MKSINKPELAQDLTDVFLPGGKATSLSPTTIGDELILTHPLLPGTHKFRNAAQLQVSAALGVTVTPTATMTVPADRYWYVFAAALTDTEAAVKSADIEVLIGTGSVSIAQGPIGATVPLGLPLVTLGRSVLLPPGSAIRGRVSAEGAGAQITLAILYVEHRLSDPHPKL